MRPGDEQRFAAAMGMLGEVFDQAVTGAKQAAYAAALEHYEIEALEAGAMELIRTAKFMPKPVEWADAAETWAEAQEQKRREAFVLARGLARDAGPGNHEGPTSIKDVLAHLKRKLGWA